MNMLYKEVLKIPPRVCMHTRVVLKVECACTQESYTVEAINPPKGVAKRGLYTQEVVMHR